MWHRRHFSLGIAAMLLSALPFTPPAAGEEGGSVELRETIAHGFEVLERGRADDAIREFKKADKLASGASAEARVGLSLAYNRVRAYAVAEKTARRALELADEPKLEQQATTTLGLALYFRADGDRARLAEVETVFRSALAIADGDDPIVKYNLGEVLLQLGRDDEGLDYLEEYLATDPTGPNAARARSLVDDPRRAREDRMPAFGLATLDGNYLTPADLQGKVVLFDFWATWCGPCRMATPALRRFHQRQLGRPFVLVGVSADSDREALESYVKEHEMTWPQAWDERGAVGHDAFRVRSYPTYLLVDQDGRVVLRVSGWNDRIRGVLTSEIKRTIEKAERAARRR